MIIAPGREAFMMSDEIEDAVIRNVEVIGEAAKRVSAEARGRLSSLDWKAICACATWASPAREDAGCAPVP